MTQPAVLRRDDRGRPLPPTDGGTLRDDAVIAALYAEAVDIAVNSASPTDRLRAARATTLTSAQQRTLAGDADWLTRGTLAERADLDPAVLDILAADRNDRVRAAVAANTTTGADILHQLALDRSESVAAAVWARGAVPAGDFHPASLALVSPGFYRTIAHRSGRPALYAQLGVTWSGTADGLAEVITDLTATA